MEQSVYSQIEEYMLSCTADSAHDREHVYRVLYNALNIAAAEENVDYDILIAACLLHDTGRKEQLDNPELCHAEVGGEKAYRFLAEKGFKISFAEQVKQCIVTHRYRKSNPPQSIEAKILFDADKLDAVGATGIARTLIYKGTVCEPIYSLLPDGSVSDGTGDDTPSFFREYKFKLEKLYSGFYTVKGSEMAEIRKSAAVQFYNSLYEEINSSRCKGIQKLNNIIK